MHDSWLRVAPGDDDCPFAAYSHGNGERHRFEDTLSLKANMPVVLLVNLGASLANGSRGRVVGFQTFEEATRPRVSRGEDWVPGQWLIPPAHVGHRQEAISKFIDTAAHTMYPLVRFDDGRVVPIFPNCTIEELGPVEEDGTQEEWSLRSRTQIPLMPGWAISIHKSQGMSISSAVIDLSSAFESGMQYVAFSRLRDL